MSLYTGELDHNISKRDRQGLSNQKLHARVNHNPSTASPGDELVIKMPQLNPDSIIYPNSLNLTYNYKLEAGKTETDVPDHLSSAIIENIKLTIDGKTITDISNYNHLAVYRELWHPKHDYNKNLTHKGIQTTATKKKRHDVAGAADDVLAAVHKERYVFNLDSFLTDAAFCPQAIHNTIEFKLKLASGNYTLANICLEYDYINEPTIASDIKAKYINHNHTFNDYKSHTTTSIKKEASDFEININASYKSLRSILIFFKVDNNVSLSYGYPQLKDVKVDIDGATNQLFSSDYLPPYSYTDAKKLFKIKRVSYGECNINEENFYSDHYCLALDLRTLDDERSSGTGREIRDYIKVKITKDTTSTDGKAFVFLVADKQVRFKNNQIDTIIN